MHYVYKYLYTRLNTHTNTTAQVNPMNTSEYVTSYQANLSLAKVYPRSIWATYLYISFRNPLNIHLEPIFCWPYILAYGRQNQ